MPIYAYKCSACGHAQDVLQKMSDPRLEICPECHQKTYTKQVTAAGFQLKGSGWYVTDFRDGGKAPASAPANASGSGDGAPSATPPPATTGGASNAGAATGAGAGGASNSVSSASSTAAAPSSTGAGTSQP